MVNPKEYMLTQGITDMVSDPEPSHSSLLSAFRPWLRIPTENAHLFI
jgi:hypothetical protein